MESHKLCQRSLLYSLLLTSLNPFVPTKIFPCTYNQLLFLDTTLYTFMSLPNTTVFVSDIFLIQTILVDQASWFM
jgi:hypothetical protein